MVSEETSKHHSPRSPTTQSRTTSSRNNPLREAAAACLATATILSSCMPPDATALGFSSTAGNAASGSFQNRHGAPTTLVLSDEDSTAFGVGTVVSSGGATDVPGLVSELKRGQDGKAVMGTMIKINDIVDADEDGVLEDSIAKQSLVKGLIDKRRVGGEAWDGDTEVAFGILKRKLDPFNVVLLRPYLQIAPFLGGAYYLAVFFVQQKFRGFFPYAYFAAVAVFVAPAAILVLAN